MSKRWTNRCAPTASALNPAMTARAYSVSLCSRQRSCVTRSRSSLSGVLVQRSQGLRFKFFCLRASGCSCSPCVSYCSDALRDDTDAQMDSGIRRESFGLGGLRTNDWSYSTKKASIDYTTSTATTNNTRSGPRSRVGKAASRSGWRILVRG